MSFQVRCLICVDRGVSFVACCSLFVGLCAMFRALRWVYVVECAMSICC